MSSTTRTVLTAIWAALHASQYGIAITSLNGISDAVTCTSSPNGNIGIHAVSQQHLLKSCIPMQATQFGLVVSIFTLGGLTGSLSSALITRQFGRIGSFRISALLLMIGSAFVGLANSVAAMMFGRVLIGIGSGLATVCVPLFLSEIAPPAIKRSLGIMNQLFIVFGMLIGQSLSFPFAKPLIWRWVFAVSSGLAVVQLAGSLLVRDPSKSDAIDAQIAGNEELPLIPSEAEKPMSIKELFATDNRRIRTGLILVIITQVSQQICGISPVMYFSTRILKPVFGSDNSRFVALFVVMFKIPLTLVPALIIERVGSRPIILFSALFMSISAVLLAFGLNTDSAPLAATAILSFVASFSVGLGPVTWVIPSEVMPKQASTAAGAIGVSLNWTMSFVMGSSFLPLQELLSGGDQSKEGNIFFLFAALCFSAFIAIRLCYAAFNKAAI